MSTVDLCHKPAPPADPDGHVHHWRIATPAGPYSRGVCRGCGKVRFFPNAPDEVVNGREAWMPASRRSDGNDAKEADGRR